MLRGLRTRLGAGALGSWERLFCQPGPGPCTLRPGTVGSGAWGPWGHEVVGFWGRELWDRGTVESVTRGRGLWSRVFGGRGVGCSGLGDCGVECLGAVGS